MRAEPLHGDAAQPARREESLANGVLIEESPSSIAAKRDPLPGREGHRVDHVPLERNETALAREDVLVLGFHMPQRSKAERVDPEDTRVTDPNEDAGRPLRERAHRRASLHVRVLKLGPHPLHLINDRREEELDRFDRGEPMTDHERADGRVDILRIAAVARQR